MRFVRPSPTWPDGFTWVFQGTIAEDATAGTHVCTLTVTPGAGNEMQVLYGDILVGAGAANIVGVLILDALAGNIIGRLVNGISLASGAFIDFPSAGQAASADVVSSDYPIMVSGAMTLKLQVSTATVSLTHTFAVACRMRFSLKPAATLLDSIGTSTNTTNTNALFG